MGSADDTTASISSDPDSSETSLEQSPWLVGTSTPGGRVTIEQYAETVHRTIDLGTQGAVLVCEFAEERARTLAPQLPGVDYIESDIEYRTAAHIPGLSMADRQETDAEWGFRRINAREAIQTESHRRPAVAVLDTGIDPGADSLAVDDGVAITETEHDQQPAWADETGHGTHAAGIVGAAATDSTRGGVCPNAALQAVKVLGEDGRGSAGDIAAGICAAVDRGVDVLLLGFSGSQRSLAVRDACRYAVAHDTLLVAAAGNSGPLENSVGYPAAFETVLAVSGLGKDDEIASFSARGGSIDLTAPGTADCVVQAQRTRSQGTSVAAAFVAGGAAALLSRGLSAQTTRHLLTETAEDINIDQDRQGSGVLDVEAAVAAVPNHPTARTVDATVDTHGEQVTVAGQFIDPTNRGPAEVWFEWRDSGADSWRSTSADKLETGGPYETTIGGLESHRRYEARACVAVDNMVVRGESVSFYTGDRIAVETAASTVLGPSAATVRGRLVHHQGGDVADVWFEYRECGTDEWHDSTVSTISRRRFAARLGGLQPDTEYEFRARGRLGNAVNVGTVGRFRTHSSPGTVVETKTATETHAREIAVSGRVEQTDDGDPVRAWFEYRPLHAEEWSTTDRHTVQPTETYSDRITDLEPDTTYEFRAVAETGDTRDTGAIEATRTALRWWDNEQ